jgi:hypothetical protein
VVFARLDVEICACLCKKISRAFSVNRKSLNYCESERSALMNFKMRTPRAGWNTLGTTNDENAATTHGAHSGRRIGNENQANALRGMAKEPKDAEAGWLTISCSGP